MKKKKTIKKKKHILGENLKRFLGASGAGYFGPAKINESMDDVDKAYGSVYEYTDEMGDEALEIMDEMLDDAGLFDLHQKHMDEEPLSADEERQLIDIYTEIAGELKHGG